MLLEKLFGPSKLASRRGPWPVSQVPGELWGGRRSASGTSVTDDDALTLSAVFAACRILSITIAMLPFSAFRTVGRGKEPATMHPAYSVLHTRPNGWMTPFVAKMVLEWNRLLGGNAYAEIQWNGGGNVSAYWPLPYWRVKPKVSEDKKDYYYLIDGARRIEKSDIIHIHHITNDGICGQSFLDYAVESIGLGITVQQAAAYSFANDARPGGYITHKLSPDKKQRDELRETYYAKHGGPTNRGQLGMFWGGWEYHDSAVVTPEQQQALESRRFSVEEVARWLNVPPHILRDLSRATFSNIESQAIEFVTYTLMPMFVQYEQEFDLKLLDPPRVYSKFNANALLRGDSNARANFFRQLWGIGVLSINDICELEDMNPIGPLGDKRFIPANMRTLEQAVEGPPPAPEPGQPADNPQPDAAPGSDQAGGGNETMQAWVTDIFSRMLRKEANAVNRAAASKPTNFPDWMDEFYPGHLQTIATALNQVVALMPMGTDPNISRLAAEKHVQRSREQLDKLIDKLSPATFAPAVAQLMIDWETNRPAQQAAEFCKGEDNAAT